MKTGTRATAPRRPRTFELWDDDAYERTARALAARGWTLDQALDGSRLGWFHGQWGPLRPYVLTSDRDQEADTGTRPWVQTGGRRL